MHNSLKEVHKDELVIKVVIFNGTMHLLHKLCILFGRIGLVIFEGRIDQIFLVTNLVLSYLSIYIFYTYIYEMQRVRLESTTLDVERQRQKG